MEKDETMLALEDDLGSIVMSQHITPGIYYVSATMGDEAIPNEYYIAERECIELSQEAKRYGQPLENHPEYLCYPAGSPDNGRMVIEYEANRYLKKHGLPLMECESLLAIADYGREYEPEYFGDYPAPQYTPKGLTLRYIILMPGIFLMIGMYPQGRIMRKAHISARRSGHCRAPFYSIRRAASIAPDGGGGAERALQIARGGIL